MKYANAFAIYSLFIIFFFSSVIIYAQEKEKEPIPVEILDWTSLAGKDYGTKKWYEIINLPDATYEDVRKVFYKEWYMKPYQKGQMYKQYKRYELMTLGVLSGNKKSLDIYSNLKAKEKMARNPQAKRRAANWTSLGPHTPFSDLNYKGIGRIDEIAFDPNDETIMYAGSPTGGFWKSTDSGNSWNPIGQNWSNLGISGIEVYNQNPNTVYVSTGGRDDNLTSFYGIQKSTDAGNTWTLITLPSSVTKAYKFLVDPTDDNKMYLGTSDGLWYSNDNGVMWNQSTNITGHVRDIEFKPNDYSTLYAVSTKKWFVSTDSASSFTLKPGDPFNTYAIDIGVTADNSDAVFFYIWDEAHPGFKLYKYLDSTDIYTLIANTSSPATYPNGGTMNMAQTRWAQQYYDWCFAINPLDENDMIIGDYGLFRTTDGGGNWMQMNGTLNSGGSIHPDMHTIEYSPVSQTPFVGCDGGLYQFNGIGNQWLRLSNMTITQIYRLGVHPLNDDKIICGTQDNGCFYNDGTIWEYVKEGDGVESFFDPIDNNTVYTGLGPEATFYKRTPIGISHYWKAIFSKSISHETASWFFPVSMHPYLRHVLYIGHQNVWKSINSGDSWTKISNNELGGEKVRYLEVAPSNPNYIYMASFIPSGGLYRSDDGGATWNVNTWPFGTNSLGALKVSSTDELTLYAAAAYNTSSIMKSIDGGLTWNDISAGLPSNVGFRTLDLVEGLTDELYAGDYVSVYHKSDGSNWQVFDTGLPNVIINELQVNELDGTITAATFGRGLWESPLENTSPICYETTIPIMDVSGEIDSCLSSMTLNISNTVPANYTVEWYHDGKFISGASGIAYTATQDGTYSARFIGNCNTFSSDRIVLHLVTPISDYSESFENGIEYSNKTDDDFNWTRRSGATPSSGTGPSAAFDGSYYVYVEASNHSNKVAILESNCFDISGYNMPLLSFAYHMYGANMGNLDIQISTDDIIWSSIFSISGNQGNQWKEKNINLSAYKNKSARFRFIGTVGPAYRSDIAIDHVHFTSCMNPIDTMDIDQTICANETHYFNNQNLSMTGIYWDTLAQTNGCDSIIRLTLNVNPIDTTDIDQTICADETYYFNNQNLGMAGIYWDTLAQINGCDSIIHLTLNVNSLDTTNIDQTICANETHYFNNQNLSMTGIYWDTLAQTNGCDSIIRLTLNVNPIDITQLQMITCNVDEVGIDSTLYTNQFDCDSLVIISNILDNEPPMLQCENEITLTLGVDNMVTADVQQLDNGTSDNCGAFTLSLSKNIFDCNEIGSHQVDLIAEDMVGNRDTCTVTINVVDDFDYCFCLGSTLEINDNPIKSKVYVYENSISSSGKINEDSVVLFKAGDKITLLVGFYAEAGSNFSVYIEDCIPTVSLLEKLAINGTTLKGNVAQLGQNRPNPVNQNTIIEYSLPNDTQYAFIRVFNHFGQEKEVISIFQSGKGEVEIKGQHLLAGMYYYSLVVDGEVIATKKMVFLK